MSATNPHYIRALFLTVFCFAYSVGLGSARTAAPLHPQDPSSASESVTIPGPRRSFLRMAGISQKVLPEQVLPLLARNVVTQGYTWQGGSRRATEYLILLRRYVEQARELQALAGAEGIIRVSGCSQAPPLLSALGYRLQGACGSAASLETAEPKRAFLTVDSGFPLADLEQALQRDKPFACQFPSTQVPGLFSQADWIGKGKNRDVLDVLLNNLELARLYWALSRMDEDTRIALRQSPGLEKLRRVGAVLDFYGGNICIRSKRVLVPGGAAAEPAWRNLVRASPTSPAEFVDRLLASDEGWLAAYFDALSRVDPAHQSYFVDSHHLGRFYEALRGKKTSPGPTRGAFRPHPDLLFLGSRLWFEPSGQPHIPGDLEVWKEILAEKTHSKLATEWGQHAKRWNNPEDLVAGLFALSRDVSKVSPVRVYLTLSEVDRRRSPEQRLSPQAVRLLADNFAKYGDQYSVFSEFHELDDTSIARFLTVADAVDRISDSGLRADALGIFQAIVGLWEILVRQGEIPTQNSNQSWQGVINPFGSVLSSAQLFDATQDSFNELMRAGTGKPQTSPDEIIDLLAGPSQASPEGQQVRRELSNKIRAVLDAQRLISLDNLFVLGRDLNQMAQGKPVVETLQVLAGELRDFELPKPLFSTGERMEWANGLYTGPHVQFELQTDLTSLLKASSSAQDLNAARGELVPFLRDTLVGLNYAYYEPPGARMLLSNPLFVRAHDPIGEKVNGEFRSWEAPGVYGLGNAAGGGAYLSGSLADLPYVLAQVEQNFIVPENVQSLIWEDLVPSLLVSAVLPRWWGVTRTELHAVSLYQRSGAELLEAAGKNEELRREVMAILSDRMLPQRASEVEEALRRGQAEEALSRIAPAEILYLAAQYRLRFPARNWGTAGQELAKLCQRYPKEVSWERLSEDFGVPHPALEQTYARELLDGKPFPALMGYSSRLLGESWDSNNVLWARLADERGYPPVMLHLLVPELTRRMVEKISATHLEDWPALLRALRETAEEFRQGKIPVLAKSGSPSGVRETF